MGALVKSQDPVITSGYTIVFCVTDMVEDNSSSGL